MLVFLRLLVQLANFHQYIGATMFLAPLYLGNFASCTISIGADIWSKIAKSLVIWGVAHTYMFTTTLEMCKKRSKQWEQGRIVVSEPQVFTSPRERERGQIVLAGNGLVVNTLCRDPPWWGSSMFF